MATDAQKRATEKYRRGNVKAFNVKFFPADADLWEWLQGHENRNRYVKGLIRADMESGGEKMSGLNTSQNVTAPKPRRPGA